MYLAKLTLNPMNYQARRDVANPYDLHRTLSRAFADNGDVGKFLFRVESAFRAGSKALIVLVQSDETKPEPENIAAAFGNYFIDYRVINKPNDELAAIFRNDAKFYFRLVANVTKKREGRRFGIYEEEEQAKWLARKGDLSGFLPLQATKSEFTIGNKRIMENMAKSDKEIPKKLIFNFGVRFDGILKVTDPGQFLRSYLGGIGPGKSFGFGLMTVKSMV